MKEYLGFMSLMKEGYLKSVGSVCEKYGLTAAEFDVLLFLANNPDMDTATDIVEKRHMVKSQVSMSVRTLEERGYLARTYKNRNRRTIHLVVCDVAKGAVEEGREALDNAYGTIMHGFSETERELMKKNIVRMINNLEQYVSAC